MYVYVYTYVCMYVYIYICVYIYMHVFVYMFVHTYVYIYICAMYIVPLHSSSSSSVQVSSSQKAAHVPMPGAESQRNAWASFEEIRQIPNTYLGFRIRASCQKGPKLVCLFFSIWKLQKNQRHLIWTQYNRIPHIRT